MQLKKTPRLMIYYYSATGNTRFAAKYLGEKLHETAVDILKGATDVPIPEEEPIGIMFPIYCWGVPPVVTQFLEKYLLARISKERYVWACCTCGDEAGTAMRHLGRTFGKNCGRNADALWSLTMPNTYVLLPGFDIDSEEVERSKLAHAPARLDEIADMICSRATGVYDVKEGSVPRLRSAVFPVFEKWGVNTKWWHVSDACIGCGKCEAVCPAGNIVMSAGRPKWGDDCFSCCSCYHCCPVKAISYASFTKNKSQYRFPGIPS